MTIRRLLRAAGGLLLAAASLLTQAAEPGADRTLAGDAACTRCHDQSESRPVLSVYRTPHGAKADGRTPGCQTCHGASSAHIRNEADQDPRPATDISFTRGGSSPAQQARACLGCHKGGQRGHWDGSAHQGADLPCSACHTVHAPHDRVLSRNTQGEVCFACHKSERAQTHRVSTHALGAGKMGCADCHNPHGSNSAPLLKVRCPLLCQGCHSGDHAAQVNSAANLSGGGITTARGALPLAGAAPRAQLGGRSCQACHMQTQGSSHPAGAKLLR